MTPDHDRALQRRLTVYAAYETIDLIGGRIRQLVSTGRRMTYIHRKSDSEQMEVRTSLHMDTSEPDGGFQVWMAQDGKGIQITCSPDVVRWGCSGFLDDGAESEVQARFERGRPNSTRVQIQGFGDGRDDNIVITTLDEHGVGCVTTIAFETDDVDERLGREVAILDLLADQGSWSGDSLRSLANHVRDEAAPVSELITRTRFGPPAR